ncbi:hypothetical protein GCM10010468_73770 [Actinocorallia longicatena]|uniref:MobA/VirD2-like nuclease domain-containing protein n=2 Tax=Actinocorallia longicatena TaxID=111803 RepID=A0ABP6QSA1_9ACTN
MDAHRKLLGKEVPSGHVWHCSISLPPGDSTDERKLNDAEWEEVAKAAMNVLGFDDGVNSPCRWIAVHHGKSVGGNEHIHLAVNLVRENGRVARTGHDRTKLQRLCAELEEKFELSVVEGRGRSARRGVSRAEWERAGGEGKEPDRRWLARVVSGVAVMAQDEPDFVRSLRGAGVDVRPKFGDPPERSDVVVGYSVARSGQGPEERLWFGGGNLDRELSLPRLRERFRWVSGSDAADVWARPSEQRVPDPLTVRAWWSVSEEAADLVERLRNVPIDDEAWRVIAGDVAGVLALWSIRVEHDYPGALAAAAEALADLARPRHEERAPRPRSMPNDFRKIARASATVARRGHPTSDQLALLRQILRVMELIEVAQVAHHRASDALGRLNDARSQLQILQLRPALRTTSRTSRMVREQGGQGIE